MTVSYAATAQGEALLFKFGDGESPEVFSAACSINTDRSVEFTSDAYTTQIPRCDDPSAPAKTVRRVKSKDIKFSGAGMTDADSFKTLLRLWEAGQPFHGQVLQDIDADGFLLDGSWIIDSLKTGGARGEEQAFDIAISAADLITITYP